MKTDNVAPRSYKEIYAKIVADGEVTLSEFHELLETANKSFMTLDGMQTFLTAHCLQSEKFEIGQFFTKFKPRAFSPYFINAEKQIPLFDIEYYIWEKMELKENYKKYSRYIDASAEKFATFFKPE